MWWKKLYSFVENSSFLLSASLHFDKPLIRKQNKIL